jgi:Ca2+-transporting ATPase
MVFTLLALSPLAHAFNCRSQRASLFSLGLFSNPLLVGAVIVSAAIHGISLVVPALQPVFKTNHTWSLAELGIVVGLSLLPVPVIELAKVFIRRRDAAARALPPSPQPAAA